MISVIMPVYNCESYIDSILNALWNQSYQDFEVICIDDGSTDQSLCLLNQHLKNHSNLKVISTHNSGPSAARNLGLESASGDYIAFVDCDDMISEQYLEDLYVSLINSDADMSVCFIERIYESQAHWFVKRFNYTQNYNLKEVATIYDDKQLLISLLNAPFAKLIRKDFLMEHNIRFMNGKIAQDFLHTKTILLCGAKVVAVPKIDYFYTVRDGSITTSKLNKAYDLRDVYEEVIQIANNKGLFELFYDEIEYLCLFHLCIDMSFRLFKGCKKLFKSIAPAKEVMKKYGFSSNNKYVKQLNWFAQLYLHIFF